MDRQRDDIDSRFPGPYLGAAEARASAWRERALEAEADAKRIVGREWEHDLHEVRKERDKLGEALEGNQGTLNTIATMDLSERELKDVLSLRFEANRAALKEG